MSVVTLVASSALGAPTKPLGALAQLSGKAGCFTHDGTSDDGANTCGKGRGMAETESAVISPDGRNVYVGSYADNADSLGAGFAIFKRNKSTGTLKQLGGKAGCITGDGASIAGAGTCTEGRGIFDSMGDGRDLAFTSNGRWAYIATNGFSSEPGGIIIFKRNPKTGALKQLSGQAGCLTTDGSDQNGPGACRVDSHLLQASGLTFSSDGLTFSSDERFLYVTGTGDSSQIEA